MVWNRAWTPSLDPRRASMWKPNTISFAGRQTEGSSSRSNPAPVDTLPGWNNMGPCFVSGIDRVLNIEGPDLRPQHHEGIQSKHGGPGGGTCAKLWLEPLTWSRAAGPSWVTRIPPQLMMWNEQRRPHLTRCQDQSRPTMHSSQSSTASRTL